jgi:hypothetical protein
MHDVAGGFVPQEEEFFFLLVSIAKDGRVFGRMERN